MAKNTSSDRYDVIVIGGGTAGLVTASGCARLGRRVALIERHALGGDCLWTGCVPTKALVSSARLAYQMRHAERWGLLPTRPAIAPESLMVSMRDLRRTIARHDDPAKFRDLGIEIIEGSARFLSSTEVAVTQTSAPAHHERILRGKDVVIATGARTSVPEITGLAEAGFLDHASFLEQNELPRAVAILGGGAIGIEFAQLFARFGVRVQVVEPAASILMKEDAAVRERLRRILREEGIELLEGWAARRVATDGSRKLVNVETSVGETRTLEVDWIFVASGRRGNVESLDLDAAGVRTEGPWVVVNRYLQTSVPRIWACGDVHGGLQFTHVAAYEAVKLVRNLLFPGRSAVDYTHVPWTLYTDPELAHVGMTEEEARASSDDVQVLAVELEDVDRAVVDRASEGMIRIVSNRRGRILGAHILAPHASTMIQEVVLARKAGMTAGALVQRISSYPSMSDGIQKAAGNHYTRLSDGWIGKIARKVAALAQ